MLTSLLAQLRDAQQRLGVYRITLRASATRYEVRRLVASTLFALHHLYQRNLVSTPQHRREVLHHLVLLEQYAVCLLPALDATFAVTSPSLPTWQAAHQTLRTAITRTLAILPQG